MSHFKINLRPFHAHACVVCFLFVTLFGTRTASAEDTIALVEVSGKRSALFQKRIKRVLASQGYTITVVGDRDEAGEVLVSIVAAVSKKRRKWEVTVEVWSGAKGDMLVSTTFRSRRPAALANTVKQKLWKRIGSAVTSAVSDVVDSPEKSPDMDEVSAPIPDKPSEVASKDDITTSADNAKSLPINATIRLHSQIYSRQFRYQGTMPQPLAEFSAPTVVAFHLEAEVFPLPDYGLLLSYGYAPSFGTSVPGMSDISFDTSSREFRVAALAKRQFGILQPRAHLEYGGQNFTVKGSLPLPNVKYRYLRVGAALHAQLRSMLSVGATLGFRSLLSAGEIESPDYFPRLSGSALDASLFIDVAIIAHWHLRASASTTNYTSSLDAQPGDPLVADKAKDRYRSVQFSVGYEL